MTRPKTKPIDYTGCDPTIAEHLKAGVAVWCEVWNSNKKSSGCRWVIGFKAGFAHSYITEGLHEYCHAKPITVKLRVKKASEIVKWFEENRWAPLSKGGWSGWHGGTKVFEPRQFIFCGDEPDTTNYKWLPEWLEEVEG